MNQFKNEDEYIINSLPNTVLLQSFKMIVQKKIWGQHLLAMSKTMARLNL